MKRQLVLCVLCAAAGAQASGFYFGDNGTKAMMQGGAFTAQADDLTATMYNPAGLTQLNGFSFLADLELIKHSVTYWRQDPGWDTSKSSDDCQNNVAVHCVTSTSNAARNPNTPYLLPYFSVGYGLPTGGWWKGDSSKHTLSFALSVFAPPSQGAYYYADPDYTKNPDGTYVNRPNKYAPQRYALVSTDILIAYPSLSIGLELTKWLQIGGSFQLTVSNFKQQQMLYAGDVLGDNPKKQLQENADYDARVGINLNGQVGVTGIVGVMVRPFDWLSFGASIRPPIHFHARGALDVTLPKSFSDLGATVDGTRTCGPNKDQLCADLDMNMPLEVRFGGRVVPVRHACALGDASRKDCGLGINADFVYLGWGAVDKLHLVPDNLSVVFQGNRTTLSAFDVQKNWKASYSVRLGATYRVFQYLSVSAGFMYETGAANSTTYSVDWTHPTAVFITGGLTGHLGSVDVMVGVQGMPTVTTDVGGAGTDPNTWSQVARGGTVAPGSPSYDPAYVGNGRYTSGGYGVLLGVRGNFEKLVPTLPPAKPIEPAPAAAPAPAADATTPAESAPATDAPAAQ